MKTILLPLRNVKQSGYYETTTDYMKIVKQNIMNLLLTYPGERVIRRNRLGVPLLDLVFEPDRNEGISLLKNVLQDNVSRYFNNIVIDYVREINVEENQDSRYFDIEIGFSDTILGNSDTITVNNRN